MIMFESEISALTKKEDDFNRWRQKNGWVTEKKGTVIRRSEFAPDWLNGDFILRGRAYFAVADMILPLRTFFLKKPIKIGNTNFYLEVKGYGAWGREMSFQEHVSGDVFYGMYLEKALQEFERIKLARNLGILTPLPVAVVEITRDDYIKKGMSGFERRLEAEIHFSLRNKMDVVEEMIGEIDELEPKIIARRLMSFIERNYKENIVEGVRFVVAKLGNPPPKWGGGIGDAANVLLSGKPVGYLIRAARCPIRVGDPSDKNIDTPQFREVAKTTGRAFRILLENRIVHHCPGTGNWTIARELTDFADTFHIDKEERELENHINELKKDGRIKKADLESFVGYLIGPKHTGLLCPYFLEGLFGEPIGLDEATRRLLKIF